MLADGRSILCLGAGGRADPTRYCLNPMLLSTDDERAGVMRHLEPLGYFWDGGQLMLRG
jgi:hypothetical protein